MIYTSGIISDINKEESLEQLQDNKMSVVCEKIGVKKGEKMLDIGCGWGTLARFASVNYGAHVTGVTLGRNQTAWGNNGLRKSGIEEDQSNILCMDYRDIPLPPGGYNKITCLEMAEHVGVRHLSSFFRQVYEMLEDDGVFFLQIAGLRKAWQFEDFTWGLFMNKYVFPGADASTPLGFVIDTLEGAGFEVKMVDTIGVHYSATLWRWYRNWLANKDKVVGKYGIRWFKVRRVYTYFNDSWANNLRSGSTSSPTPQSPRARALPHASRSLASRISTLSTVSRVSTPSSVCLLLSLLAARKLPASGSSDRLLEQRRWSCRFQDGVCQHSERVYRKRNGVR
jgi:cyclopropane fatty-acyl-phospholipid synthase-like methyltransferase